MAQSITVSGMTCEGCEQNVEKALRSLSEVRSVHVDHTTDSAIVEGNINPDTIRQAIKEAGYEASI
jgi:copper chaperone